MNDQHEGEKTLASVLWDALPTQLCENFDNAYNMYKSAGIHVAFDSITVERLLLVPLVKVMGKNPVVRQLYPQLSHAYLRLSYDPWEQSTGRLSNICAAIAGQVQFRVLEVRNGWGIEMVTLYEGTAAEVTNKIADFVRQESGA